jgi:hypothetical protein
VHFTEHATTWTRLKAQGVVATEGPADELHLDFDDSATVVAFDVAAEDHAKAARLPAAIRRVARREIGPIVEGVVHKLKLPEVVAIPVGRWREVFDAVAQPMSTHAQWREIDAAAMVELNTRDPLKFGPEHHHMLRDLVDAVVAEGQAPAQGITIVALGVRLLLEVLPAGQLIILAGDDHLAAPIRAVIDHHSPTA